ncbi:hypothetical protein MMC10_004668 [Thelotrema lepadinum]|nr:hypothetical protein [Thelotrema lepadinum]
MALPPQLIKLKRKRGDEPVDTLYIQREGKEASKKQQLDSSFKFQRLRPSNEENDLSSSAVIVGSDGQTDKLPKDEAANNARLDTNYSSMPLTAPESTSSQKRKEPPTDSPLRPKRVFHLSQERSSSTLRRSSSNTSLNRIHKQRGPRRSGIAVFSEQKRKANLQKLAKRDSISNLAKSVSKPQAEGERPELHPSTTNNASSSTQPRKRPTASAQERKWRDSTWTKPSAKGWTGQDIPEPAMDTNGYDDALDLKLVAELQAWSVEEARAHPAPSSTQPASTLAEGQSKGDLLSRQQANAKPLKHRPKPQPPREPTPNPPPTGVADANPDANPMDDADLMDQDEDDDEYVYDTYIREPELSTSTRTSTNPNTTTTLSSIQAPEAENSGLNVGYLIIRAQDTEAWEEFLSDGEGDSEGEWESSDSNAEDYRGNDYPEDEDGDGSSWVGSDEYGAKEGTGSEYGSGDAEWDD